MFLLNIGYRWKLASELEDLDGAVFLASGNTSERLRRSRQPEFKRLLFDPQLYLARLDANICKKTCARLASYEWFGVPGIPSFDSGVGNRSKWEEALQGIVPTNWPSRPPEGEIQAACLAAIQFQLDVGCTHIILPSPLIEEREGESALQATWLDEGLQAAKALDIGQPLLTTVALSESVLNDQAFFPAGFLDTIVDQVTAREGLDGTYIVIAQADALHPFDTTEFVQRAYLHLSRAFSKSGHDPVVCNFADVFGFVCMAGGATAMVGGESHQRRRLALAQYRDESGGTALPHFYSHRVVGEFLTETDLNGIVSKRLLGRIRDTTAFSAPLLDALADGRTAANLPQWAESRSNMAVAQKHFVTRLLEEARVSRLPLREREDRVRDWLETAAGAVVYLQERLDRPGIGRFAPANRWLGVLDATP